MTSLRRPALPPERSEAIVAGARIAVILCHPGDAAALWLHAELARLGCAARLVAVEQLVYSRGITHRMEASGDSGAIRLADGCALRVEAIGALVNRVEFLPQRHFDTVAAADRAYALEELNAFLLAWLDAVPGRVINPARPGSLGGSWLPAPTLAHLAATAGLPVDPWQADSAHATAPVPLPPPSHSNVVFDGRVYGRIVSRAVQDACRRLAALAGMPLLQVDFDLSNGRLRFQDARGAADFRIGGRALVAAIADAAAASMSARP